jgi:hypothetical protein
MYVRARMRGRLLAQAMIEKPKSVCSRAMSHR